MIVRGHPAGRAALVALLLALVTWLAPQQAGATTIEHVVVRGDTLGFIAKRHGTSVRAIEQINGLQPGRHLYPGQKLLVPSNRRPPPAATVPSKGVQSSSPTGSTTTSDGAGRGRALEVREENEENEPDEGDDPWICSRQSGGRVMALPRFKRTNAKGATDYQRKPAKPGVVSLKRYGETFRDRIVTDSGALVEKAQEKITHLMRDLRTRKEHPVDARLLKLLVKVSDHYGGRTIVVVSGYREFSPRQHSRTSRHNVGQAVDFRVVGVPVEALWEYCLSLGDVGVGYYPTSAFVHLDVRGYDAAWVDTSRPGQRPVYACRRAPGDERAAGREQTTVKGAPPSAASQKRPGSPTKTGTPSARKRTTIDSEPGSPGKRNTASVRRGASAASERH